ncbi:MAG: hypothetical protein AUI58_06590 [Chloroflexi bacterium 13_1_40CM_2_70_6]|nr:MAG: hypothetical protein AUI58_06590 [Chloroflexi bacterium 13_1_40CM_2_70_6]
MILPKLGLTMDEGRIVAWRKREGDRVRQGEILFEVERYVTASFWSSLAWRAYDALISARAMRRGFSELLAAAEREGARSPVS